jgi:hypothetical protein
MQYPALSVVVSFVVLAPQLVGCVSPPGTAETTEAQEILAPAVIPPCAINTWCAETAPVSGVLLGAVSAASASAVFAVGDGGTILERTGGSWVTMTSGTTNDLRGVWALSSSDVWAAGVSGTVLHYNGTSWSSVSGAGTGDIAAVWASGASDVWFASESAVLHWNGTTFSSSGMSGPVISISGTSSSDVWAASENSGLHHWNGTAWSSVTTGASSSIFVATLAISTTDVWATYASASKPDLHLSGTTWKAFAGWGWSAMAAFSTSDVWGVGASKAGHWNGTAWTTSTPFGSVALYGVTTAPSNVWAVGDASVIEHFQL